MDIDLTRAHIEAFRLERGVHSIVLPNQVGAVDRIALDMGGSLVKQTHFEASEQGGGKLHFAKYPVTDMDKCLDAIVANKLHVGGDGTPVVVKTTGGGAYKFHNDITAALGVAPHKEDEMASLIKGLNFLLRNVAEEAFTYPINSPRQVKRVNGETEANRVYLDPTPNPFPYLLVQIGSGVSFIRVSGEDEYERVSGSSLGGGTFWGLCRLLTNRSDFDDMLDLTTRGDHRNVDTLVGDIYGQDYGKVGLPSTVIASSFGKVMTKKDEDGAAVEGFDECDLANSLLRLISNNIAQLAFLIANNEGLKRIYFGGSFVRDHPVTMSTITFGIDFWSKNEMRATFLKHDGVLGSIGAFLL